MTVCSECGAPFAEHRWVGEFQMHPGFADTWEEHVRIANTLTPEERPAALHERQRLLRAMDVIPR